MSVTGWTPVQEPPPSSVSAWTPVDEKPVQDNTYKGAAAGATTIGPQSIPSGIGDKISTWAQNVANDIKYGTDVTGVGTVLKKMGAHGVYSGVPEAVGDYMAGLPLGTLKMAQGAGEIAGSAPTSQGLKDIGSGALQALASPEAGIAGEAAAGAGKAVSAGAKVATNATANMDEWRKINDILNVSQKGIRIGPEASSLQAAATMPGRALANAGFTADSLSKMSPLERSQAITPLWREAGRAIDTAAKTATDAGKTLDVGNLATQTIKKIANPELQDKAIQQFNYLVQELGIADQRAATPEEALALRRALQSGARFTVGDMNSLGGVRAELYRSVSGDLKNAIPGLDKLDQNYSDLKGALDASMKGVRQFATSAPEPTTMEKVADYTKKTALPWLIRGAVGGAGLGAGHEVVKLLTGGGEP